MSVLRLRALMTRVDVEAEAVEAIQAVRILANHLGSPVTTTNEDEPAPRRGPGNVQLAGEPGAWYVSPDRETPGIGPSPDLQAVVVTSVTRSLVETTPLLGVHAGVVRCPTGLVVMPGASGHGKTTLVGALVQAGFGYVSDEVLAFDRVSGAVHPFRRPLALDRDAWQLLELDPRRLPEPGHEEYVRLDELGTPGEADRVVHVLLTRRRPGPPVVTAASRGEGAAALLSNSFNHFKAPKASLLAVVQLVQQAQVWHAGYEEATQLSQLLQRHDWPETAAK